MSDRDILAGDKDPGKCKRCGGTMRVGRAMDQTYTGVADFVGGELLRCRRVGRVG